jgi:diphthamide synthase (EF-2-diphthine--ammonia ligase)
MSSHVPVICYAWSGGKDSFLAFRLDQQTAAASKKRVLFVTFVPQQGEFRCHPLGLLETHGLLLGVPHIFISINPEQWQHDYTKALIYLREFHGVETLVTGDIFADSSEMNENWLACLSSELGIEFRAPLLGYYWTDIFALLASFQITAVVSGMVSPFYRKEILGQRAGLNILVETFQDNASKIGFDMCGERGEYHTTVTAIGTMKFSSHDLSGHRHVQIGSVWSLDLPAQLRRLKQTRIFLDSAGRGPARSARPPASAAPQPLTGSTSAAVCADPGCSISSDPRGEECTICTATAPDDVFAVHRYGDTRPQYGPG